MLGCLSSSVFCPSLVLHPYGVHLKGVAIGGRGRGHFREVWLLLPVSGGDCLAVTASIPGSATCGSGRMALSWLERAELLLYAAAFICGIISAASLTVGQGEFGGQCILYGTVAYNSTSDTFDISKFSSFSLCYFVSAISVLIALYCFSIVLYWVYASCIDDIKRGSIWLTISLVVSVLIIFFLLVSACILRVGMDSLCSSIVEIKKVESCSQAQTQRWKPPSDGSNFYYNLHSAESSAWVNLVLWLIILVLLCIQRRKESSSAFRPLAASDPEWATGETDAIFAPRTQRP